MFVSKDRLAQQRGLRSFDTALPQTWLDAAADVVSQAVGVERGVAYDSLMFGTVWCYDGSLLGFPVAVNDDADRALKIYLASLNSGPAARS